MSRTRLGSQTRICTQSTQTRLQSETADRIMWFKYALLSPGADIPNSLRAALSRIEFSDFSTPTPLHAAIQRASAIRAVHKRLLIVSGRSRRLAIESGHRELKEIFEEYRTTSPELVTRMIGDVASSMVISSSASVSSCHPIGIVTMNRVHDTNLQTTHTPSISEIISPVVS